MADERPANVHRHHTADGEERWGVGTWQAAQGQYHAPLDAETRRLTGCSAEFARRPIGRFVTADAAKREAKRLWGYARESE